MLKPLALACAILIAAAATAMAATPRDALLVSTDWLSTHARDANLVVLHAGSKAEYDNRHIPGALFVAQDGLSVQGPGGMTLELPAAEVLRTQMQALGISDRSRVVIYYERGRLEPATRLILTLDAAGLGDRVSLLDGGLEEWVRAGKAVTKEASVAKAGGVLSPLKMRPKTVGVEFVRGRIHTPGYVVIDGRAGVFFDGVSPGGAPPTRGHIPGAKSIPYTSIVGTDFKVKSADQLAAMFKAAGVKSGDRVIAYCHVGQQATAVIFAARTLGIDAVLYDGSFQDWSQRRLPVESPTGAAAG